MTLLKYRMKETHIEIDGEEFNKKMLLLAVGNGQYYGGGMKILPDAKIDDGFLHLCLVKDINNLKLLFLFPSIFKGDHLKYKKHIEIYKAKEILIKNKGDFYLNIDGDLVQTKDKVEFKVSPQKLDIIYE